MKKTVSWRSYTNVLPDFFVDDVSRAYINGSSIFIVLGSTVGVESSTEVFKSEALRLVIPFDSAHEVSREIKVAVECLIGNSNVDSKPNRENSNSTIEDSEKVELGKPFDLID